MVKLSILGASGRMGRSIISLMNESHELLEAVERPGAEVIGQALSSVLDNFKGDQIFVDALSKDTDVVVDFAAGPGLAGIADLCAERGWALVTGRTGLSDLDQKAVEDASKKVAVLQAGNMSLGANVLMRLGAIAAKAMPDAELKISETHHVHKKDAPSGTALMLARAIEESLNLKATIEIESFREGETVGDHSVELTLFGEKIELSHKAGDRQIFAKGALLAAEWLASQKPGFYAMTDVLGI
jgi:4-hydroxy-tetrahydrodipicolinate reductase